MMSIRSTNPDDRLKIHTARLSVISNSGLVILKLFAGLLSGSISIVSEAIHSGMDLMAAVIAFFSVRISGKPPDRDHPYGHGKYENISGVVEALLIVVASAWIIFEAWGKLLHPSPLRNQYLGAAVMLISALVNLIISRRLYAVAKKTDSVALEADALHLKTDVYTSAGVGVGLLLIELTGISIIDPLIALGVASIILFEASTLLKKAYKPLLDTCLPETDIEQIRNIIQYHMQGCIRIHQFRTRKAGPRKYVDFHLEVPGSMSVSDAHGLCDRIEDDIQKHLGEVDINIHIEPCAMQKTEGQDGNTGTLTNKVGDDIT
ncbi:MAG: cation transporter [Bacteroidales bacterium]|nr:cation transporter [Bacteroidales bacterium]